LLSAVIAAVGDVLMLHDADTGASDKDVVRPCAVVTQSATIVIVALRSVSITDLVPTPADASAAFNKPGSFSRWRAAHDAVRQHLEESGIDFTEDWPR
jgi:hypothetical protein